MGFCTKEEYDIFMEEVSNFEKLLIKSDIRIFKFFLTVSKDIQKKRFEKRKNNSLKEYKLSNTDLKDQDLWENIH